MYIIKNALKNLMRNKGRNFLMMVIVLAIMMTTSIALIINNTASNIIDDYKNQFGSQVTIGVDINKVMEARQNGENLTFTLENDMMIDFANSEYLKTTSLTSQFSLFTENLIGVDQDSENSNFQGGQISIGGANGGREDGGFSLTQATMPNIKIVADSNTAGLTDFNEGSREIIEGRMYENKDEVIISSDLAELNGLSVGDVIVLEATNYNDEQNVFVFNLEVVGIYFDTTESANSGGFISSFANRKNEILTSFETLVNDYTNDLQSITVNAVYYLNNPGLIDEFEAEVRAKGLMDWFNVSTDENTYNTIVGPVVGLKSITLTFVMVVLALGGIILILLSSLAMRERKYEVGVLRAIGMKKGQVIFGLVTEMLTITLVCLILGMGIGVALSQPISDKLLENQIAAIQNQNNNNQTIGGGGTRPGGTGGSGPIAIAGAINIVSIGANNAEAIDELQVGIDINTILQLAGIALSLAGIASIVGVGYITRYEPIRILSERN